MRMSPAWSGRSKPTVTTTVLRRKEERMSRLYPDNCVPSNKNTVRWRHRFEPSIGGYKLRNQMETEYSGIKLKARIVEGYATMLIESSDISRLSRTRHSL